MRCHRCRRYQIGQIGWNGAGVSSATIFQLNFEHDGNVFASLASLFFLSLSLSLSLFFFVLTPGCPNAPMRQ